MTTKSIAAIVIVIAVIAGVWYMVSKGGAQQPAAQDTNSAINNPAPVAQPLPTPPPADVSDSGLANDAAQIDTQLQAASADANTAASFSDTPVAQTE